MYASRFMINLVENDDDGKNKNIILHINPRFDEAKCVLVRNTNIMGHWGPEERDGGFPLEPGKNFEAVIVVHDNCYKVHLFMKRLKQHAERDLTLSLLLLSAFCFSLSNLLSRNNCFCPFFFKCKE